MGYTHYWNFKSPTENYTEQKRKALMEIEVLLERMPKHSTSAGGYYLNDPLKIKGGDGVAKFELKEKDIWLNGDAKDGYDHGTFFINLETPGTDFDFCKTARKPYDFVVCAMLLSLANHLENFEFSSDGDKEDWQPVVTFYLEQNNNYISDNLKKSLEKINK
jgi:hypothetical protein